MNFPLNESLLQVPIKKGFYIRIRKSFYHESNNQSHYLLIKLIYKIIPIINYI